MKEYGMSFKTLKHKFQNIFNQTQSNLNDLDKKSNKFKFLQKNININKKNRIIYDSDWFYINVFDSPSIIDINENLYAYIIKSLYGISDGSTIKGVEYFLDLNYGFSEIVDIPENFLPFLKVNVLTKKQPNINFLGATLYNYYVWDEDNSYYQIKGDSTVIYQGLTPENDFHTEEERINGDFSTSLCGKWFHGTLEYTASGDSYELQSSYILRVNTTYDVEPLVGHPGYFSYKAFGDVYAIDSISSSSVTGTGTYSVVTAYEDGGGNPQISIVETKNATMTSPLFEDYTTISATGFLYKNSSFYAHYDQDSPLNISFPGLIGTGTAVLTAFNYSWGDLWRIFYSIKRASAFRFDDSLDQPYNLPSTILYETASLPYSTINTEKNPNDYPEETIKVDFKSPNSIKPLFAKITENKFKIYGRGRLIYSELALESHEQTLDYIDENYTQDGNTYSRVAINRPGKQKIVYLPSFTPFQIKFQLVLDDNFIHSDNIKYNK